MAELTLLNKELKHLGEERGVRLKELASANDRLEGDLKVSRRKEAAEQAKATAAQEALTRKRAKKRGWKAEALELQKQVWGKGVLVTYACSSTVDSLDGQCTDK